MTRPLLSPEDGRRVPLSVRLTPRMRRQLVELAQANGRSLAQQTELVLEQGLQGLGVADRLDRIERKVEALAGKR
jgi:hypothetical protein